MREIGTSARETFALLLLMKRKKRRKPPKKKNLEFLKLILEIILITLEILRAILL